MLYRGKNLPSWVCFRRKTKPLPIYTVPTKTEWQFAQMMALSWERVAKNLLKTSPLLNDVKWADGATIRVRLPSSYTTQTKGTPHD